MSEHTKLFERAGARYEPPDFRMEELLKRQDRKRRNQRIRAGALGIAIAIAVGWLGINAIRSTPPVPADDSTPTEGLGIFAPVAGRIVFTDSGLWAADPSAPSRSTLVRVDVEDGQPLGWSTDGTELLLRREDPTDQTFPYDAYLYILHADGTETQLNSDAMLTWDATIAPDGSRVVFAAADDAVAGRPLPTGLFVVDAEGGQPIRIAEEGGSPAFSPDGTQIAYLVSGRDDGHLWVADADGSDAHEILANKPKVLDGVSGLQWSPAGDRLAMANTYQGSLAIYTVAPDGSDFTEVITGGFNPYWSPDGSQIAYIVPGGSHGLTIADADGSNVREFGFGASGPWHPGGPTETGPPENGEAVAEPYEFLDGQLTFSVARPWDNSVAGWEGGPNMVTLDLHRVYEERFMLVADPLPVGKGCEHGPAPADAEALALSIRSDPDLEATEPVVVSVGGIDALRMDVVAATGASLCLAVPAPQVVAPPPTAGHLGQGTPLAHGHRMRLYLIDLPGGSARILAIAIIAPDARFEHVVDAATPILDSFEFHTG
jgi:WD40-like Beta Propeller Repeat